MMSSQNSFCDAIVTPCTYLCTCTFLIVTVTYGYTINNCKMTAPSRAVKSNWVPSHNLCSLMSNADSPRVPPIDDLYDTKRYFLNPLSRQRLTSAGISDPHGGLASSSCFVVLFFVLRPISLAITVAALLPIYYQTLLTFSFFLYLFSTYVLSVCAVLPFLATKLVFWVRRSPALMQGQNGGSFACQLRKYCPNAARSRECCSETINPLIKPTNFPPSCRACTAKCRCQISQSSRRH